MLTRLMPEKPNLPQGNDVESLAVSELNMIPNADREDIENKRILVTAFEDLNIVPFDPEEVERYRKESLKIAQKEFNFSESGCAISGFLLIGAIVMAILSCKESSLWFYGVAPLVVLAGILSSVSIYWNSFIAERREKAGIYADGYVFWWTSNLKHIEVGNIDLAFLDIALKFKNKVPAANFVVEFLAPYNQYHIKSLARLLKIELGNSTYYIDLVIGKAKK